MEERIAYARKWMLEVLNYLRKRNETFWDLAEEDDWISKLDVVANYGKTSSGSFRITFIPNDADFVIKVGYTTRGREMCEREAFNWKAAVEKSMEKFFAPFYGSFQINDIKFYLFAKIPEVAIIADNPKSHPSYRSEEELEKIVEDCKPWMNPIYYYYKNLEDIVRMATFCGAHGIDDLHQWNFGFVDGFPVAIDYAGV